MSDMSTNCTYCGKDIEALANINLYKGFNITPALLHKECYEDLKEYKWKYEGLNE